MKNNSARTPFSNRRRASALRTTVVGAALLVPAWAYSYTSPISAFSSGDPVVAADFNTIFDDIYAALNEIDEDLEVVIDVDTTWTVGAGEDFETLEQALDGASHARMSDGAKLTLQLVDGSHALSGEVTFSHPQGPQIRIVGNSADETAVSIDCDDASNCFSFRSGNALGEFGYLTINVGSAGYAVRASGGAVSAHDIVVNGGAGAFGAWQNGHVHASDIVVNGIAGTTYGGQASDGGNLVALDWTFSTGNTGFYASNGGNLVIERVAVDDAVYGVRVDEASSARTLDTTYSNITNIAQYANAASRLRAVNAVCESTVGIDCVVSTRASLVNINSLTCDGATGNCLEATNLGRLILQGTSVFTNVAHTDIHGNRAGDIHVTYGTLNWNGTDLTAFTDGVHYTENSFSTITGISN